MTLAHKIFWFFAICLVVKLIIPGPAVNTYSAPEAVSADANKCKNGDRTQMLTLQYDGKVIERLVVDCPR